MTGPHGTGVLSAGASRAAPGPRNPALSRHAPVGTHPTGGQRAGAGSDAHLPAPAASAARTALGPSQRTGTERARGSNRDRRANSGTAPKSSEWEISRCPSGEGPSQVPAPDRVQRGRGREGPLSGDAGGCRWRSCHVRSPHPQCQPSAPECGSHRGRSCSALDGEADPEYRERGCPRAPSRPQPGAGQAGAVDGMAVTDKERGHMGNWAGRPSPKG